MASRLGKHLFRAKSKAENFGFICSLPRLFFICCLAVPWLIFDIIEETVSLTYGNDCIWAINFWSKGDLEGLGLYP